MLRKLQPNLRATVLSSMILVTAASVVVFAKIWVPRLNELGIEVQAREVDRQLDIIADSLTPFVLSNQFAGIHETLNALMARNDNWIQIKLINSDGRQIYPLSTIPDLKNPNYWSTSKEIMIRDDEVGKIFATVDFSADLNRLTIESRNLGLLWLTMLLAAMLVIWVAIEGLVVRRLKLLSDASRELAIGNYSAVLPPEGYDEVGALSSSFRMMRENIRENEIELTEATRVAQDATNAKSQFLATMSHEIRTPMNGVIPVAELLAATDLDTSQRRLVETIHLSGQALSSIIDDILDFSRLDAGRMSLRSEPFQLIDLIEDVCDILGPSVLARKIAIQSYIDPALCGDFLGDGERLRQVVLNLAGNAAKFTETGGIGIRSKPVVDFTGSRQIQVEITDTGIGIPRKDIDGIFGRFTQVENNASRNFGGSGLGLSISRMLIEEMGGEIGVQSELGEGSTFWFRIPLIPVKPIAEKTPEGTSVPQQIVLIDKGENGSDGQFIFDTLQASGHDVWAFSSVQRMNEWLLKQDVELTHIVLNSPVGRPDILKTWLEELAKGSFSTVIKIVLLAEEEGAICGDVNISLKKPVHRRDLLDGIDGAKLTSDRRETVVGQRRPLTDEETSGFRILVVDDNQINQEVAYALLNELGHACVVAGDGQQAVDAVVHDDFDLVLMDVQMPVKNGLDATREIRALGDDKSFVKILGLSASATEEECKRCYDAGMDDFLSKPLNRSKLAAMLDAIMES